LATNLPEFITVDLGQLTKGQSVHASDLKLGTGIKLVTHGRGDATLATVVEPKEEAIVDPAAAAAAPAAEPAKGKKGK